MARTEHLQHKQVERKDTVRACPSEWCRILLHLQMHSFVSWSRKDTSPNAECIPHSRSGLSEAPNSSRDGWDDSPHCFNPWPVGISPSCLGWSSSLVHINPVPATEPNQLGGLWLYPAHGETFTSSHHQTTLSRPIPGNHPDFGDSALLLMVPDAWGVLPHLSVKVAGQTCWFLPVQSAAAKLITLCKPDSVISPLGPCKASSSLEQ